MRAYELMENRGVKFVTFPLFTETGAVKHGFSTRQGGVSPSPYDSLNLGFHVDDTSAHVLENRSRAARALGVKLESLVAGGQVHGDRVQIITEQHRGLGARSDIDALPGVDALVTDRPEVPLVSFYADCVPVFILDPHIKVVALAHAGWKGTVLRIAEKTVEVMRSTFGCRPENCLAVIAPSIGKCCYEVDERVIGELKKGFKEWREFAKSTGEGSWKLDLAAVNRAVLMEAGLVSHNVVDTGLCTACNEKMFFSYRASGGKTGRMGAIMQLN